MLKKGYHNYRRQILGAQTSSSSISRDICPGGSLSFPGLSIVIIQTFTLNKYQVFAPVNNGIPFFTPASVPINPWLGNVFVSDYELKGFDFSLMLGDIFEGKETQALEGHCRVRVDCFHEHTLSVTYRFVFDQNICHSSTPFSIDDIILFLNQCLAETSYDHPDEEVFVRNTSGLQITSFPLNEDGSPREKDDAKGLAHDNGNLLRGVFLCYKKCLIRHTFFKKGTPKEIRKGIKQLEITDRNDILYALVDIWENIRHPLPSGEDLFSRNRASSLPETEIIKHVKAFHKKEIIGLMSLEPYDWLYKDEDSFEKVCGENIAVDTDGLILAGDQVSVIFGTYFLRGAAEEGVLWGTHLRTLFDGLTWPAYLLLLQFRLAQKSILQSASKELLTSISGNQSASQIIADNRENNYFFAKTMLEFDAVEEKYSSDSTVSGILARHLDIETDRKTFEHNMQFINDALESIKEGQSSSREVTMNIILGIVSVISAFQLFFVGTKMPFLSEFWHVQSQSSSVIGAIIISAVAVISIVIVLVALYSVIRGLLGKK